MKNRDLDPFLPFLSCCWCCPTCSPSLPLLEGWLDKLKKAGEDPMTLAQLFVENCFLST